jgi:DNA-binding Lrp family transcriptional regulator
MDETDAQLLDVLQTSVPLVARPWRQLAGEFDLAEDEVQRRVAALRQGGVIRRIGGVFEAARLGYRQTLLGLAVEPERMDHAAEVVAGHPGVSHCYSRSDEYNLWATLAVSPDSRLGLEQTVELLAERCGAKAYLNLPAKQRFKLSVRFGRKRGQVPFSLSIDKNEKGQKKVPDPFFFLSDEQKQAVRALQMDLPLVEQPFDAIAHAEKFALAEELLVHAADLLAAGVLRRYAAVVHPKHLGAEANVMVVWRVLEKQASLAGAAAAQHQAVSHCYLRETTDDWPFNLYTMIHGSSREECLRVIESISADIGCPDRRELETIREYKKSPVQFFTAAEAAWEKGGIADCGLRISD